MKIWIKTTFPAFHKYKNAPEEVKFLRSLHRHLFYIKVFLSVEHNNRELEFFMVKRRLEQYINKHLKGKTLGSCEMIAIMIQTYLEKKYKRKVAVQVSEDNENGVILE